MSEGRSNCELPSQIDRLLAALSKLYAAEGKRDLQELIVNAQTRVHEEWDYDNWDGGIYGHALYLVLPEQIYIRSARERDTLQAQLREDLNRLHNVRNESISAVFFEIDVSEEHDWRGQSGLLLAGKRLVTPDAAKRIWEEGCFRLFLSHKSDNKDETAELKKALNNYGISAFVAHEDIKPTEAWQGEIENALETMDGFLAVLTPNFHESEWTDQEVGFAFARGVPMIALKLGRDPYGFIGKFQGLSASWPEAPGAIAKLLIRHDRMFAAWLKQIRECWSFGHGNQLAELLPALDRTSESQIDDLVETYNNGRQISGSYGFNGTKPGSYGRGLVEHLNRLSKRRFRFDDWKVAEIKENP